MSQAISPQSFAPEYFKPEDDVTHPVQHRPLWSESYQTDIYDPQAQVGIHMHFSRAPFNVMLFHDLFAASLPGDQFLVAKNFRYGDKPGYGPEGGAVRYECKQPFYEWTKRFYGAAQLVSGEELRAGALRDGKHVSTELELNCRAVTPAFNAGMLAKRFDRIFWHDADASHYQQFCVAEGFLSYDGNRTPLSGKVMRDHSWGPRDLSILERCVWLSCHFPSGRSFMVMEVESRTEFAPTQDYLIDTGSGFELATIGAVPMLVDDSNAMDPYVLELTTSDVRTHRIEATVIQACPINVLGQNEMGFGADHRPESRQALWDSFVRYEWDGEVGYGHAERSVPRPIAE
jgi:hypothetical protein